MEDSLIIVVAALLALAYVFVVRIYIAYAMAKSRHRDPIGWILLSVFVSPLLTWIILLIAGDDKSALEREERQAYLVNAYRVLLTRARQGMVICVPEGNPEDPTRLPEFYNGTYEYLKSLGIEEL